MRRADKGTLFACMNALVCARSTAERVKPARGNRTSKGAEKWLDVQEHRGTGATIAHLRAAGCAPAAAAATPPSASCAIKQQTGPEPLFCSAMYC